jgi:hypothetical protein
MNPARTKALRLTILEQLKHAQGYALPDETLRSMVNSLMRPPVSDEEWTHSMDWLETNTMTVRVGSDLDASLIQHSITERGRVALQTL